MASIIAFIILSLPTWGIDGVFLVPTNSEIRVTHTSSSENYLVDNPANLSAENTAIVYIPVASNTNSNYNLRGNNFLASLQGTPTRTGIQTTLRVEIDDTSKTWDLFVAAKENNASIYRVFHNEASVAEGNRLITVDLADICDIDTELDIDCTNFRSGNPDREHIEIFISIGEQGSVDAGGSPDSITPENFQGIHLNLHLNSQIQDTPPDLTDLKKGDGRLLAIYDGSTLDEARSNFAYVESRGTGLTDDACAALTRASGSVSGTLAGGMAINLGGTDGSGYNWVKGLNNDTCYTVRVYFVDKYQFAGQASNGRSAIPEDIEALLQKQNCYLLTAGFGGEHPTVEYFRKLRDESLSTYAIGRLFINWYYTTAPHYTPFILGNSSAQTVVRGMATMLKWVLTHWTIVLITLLGLGSGIGIKLYGRTQ